MLPPRSRGRTRKSWCGRRLPAPMRPRRTPDSEGAQRGFPPPVGGLFGTFRTNDNIKQGQLTTWLRFQPTDCCESMLLGLTDSIPPQVVSSLGTDIHLTQVRRSWPYTSHIHFVKLQSILPHSPPTSKSCLKLAHVRRASHAELNSSVVLVNDISRVTASGGGDPPPSPVVSPPIVLSSDDDLPHP